MGEATRRTARRKAAGLCTKCGKNPPALGLDRCQACGEKEAVRLWRERKRTRLEVITHYSPERKCACCGESDYRFLTLDHIDGKGSLHKREIGRCGTAFLRWLKHNNFPEGYQVLCWNCNCGRTQYGICPHKIPKEESDLQTIWRTNSTMNMNIPVLVTERVSS